MLGQAPATRRPNVLFVFGDQHRAQSLGTETSGQLITPALDRFRHENFSMDTCVSNYPLCTPYRGILMSGRWPAQTGIMFNNMPLEMHSGSLGETFQQNGFHTGYVGKWHLAGHGESPGFIPSGPRRLGFEDWQVWDATNNHYEAWTYDQNTGQKIFPKGWQPTCMTDEAIQFISKQSKAQPWLLVVSWNPPHPPYNPPQDLLAMYPTASFQLRANVKTRSAGPEMTNVARFLTSDEGIRTATQGYYGAITGIDREFARLLKALDDTGQARNTIVVYTSDHGDMMGSQGRMAKQVPFEESCRVPFMVRVPGAAKPGRSSALFAAVDIYPTLCGLAGLTPPASCVGRDLSPVIRGGHVMESEMVFLMNQIPTTFNKSFEVANNATHELEFVNQPSYRGVRTNSHTYAVADSGRWLLFDNNADPYQLNNLISDPARIPLMKDLDNAITQWIAATGDPFPYHQQSARVSKFSRLIGYV